jgi:hypothetical protein
MSRRWRGGGAFVSFVVQNCAYGARCLVSNERRGGIT